MKIAPVKEAFSSYFAPRVREEFERYIFYSRVQSKTESFDSFLTAVQGLMSTCNFHAEKRDKALRDRIVLGTNSEAVREELLNSDSDLSLDKCTRVCRRAEATKQYLSHMSQQPRIDTQHTAHAVSNARSDNKHDECARLINSCRCCSGTHPARNCPAYGKECRKCSKKGHFAKMCQSASGTYTKKTLVRTMQTIRILCMLLDLQLMR